MYFYGEQKIIEDSKIIILESEDVLIEDESLIEEDWYSDVKNIAVSGTKSGVKSVGWLARKRHGNIPKYTDALAQLGSSVFKKIENIKPLSDAIKREASGDIGNLNKIISGLDRKSRLSYVEILSAIIMSALENPSDKSYSYIKSKFKSGSIQLEHEDEDEHEEDDSKQDDSKSEDSKQDDSKSDDSKQDDSKQDDSKQDDSKSDDSKSDDSKSDDSKAEDKINTSPKEVK